MNFSGEEYFQTLFNAVPLPIFIVDKNLKIHDANQAAIGFSSGCTETTLKRLCGEVLSCIHDQKYGGCGNTPFCPDCVLRRTAEEVCEKQTRSKKTAEMLFKYPDREKTVWLQISGAPLEYRGKHYAIVTVEEISELVSLRSILPICMHCQKVRDDGDYWNKVEEYLLSHSTIKYSHGICPDCLDTHYPKYAGNIKKKLAAVTQPGVELKRE